MVENEADLVLKASQGDTIAFESLVLTHQSFVYNLALRAVGDPHEAQDLTQEAFLNAWKGLPTFRGQSQFRTWLYRIVLNLCYNRRPRLRRQMNELGVEEVEEVLTTGSTGSAERQYVRQEQRELVQSQIQKLPETYRLLVMLRYQNDLSYEEIAEVVSMPLGTVKTGLFRAKEKLRAALQAREEVIECI